ncbi:MAG: hypothetical protein MRY63_05770 [Neomegalonema sp.]|nr:hypothetical protein [Neomegalonema sp.]
MPGKDLADAYARLLEVAARKALVEKGLVEKGLVEQGLAQKGLAQPGSAHSAPDFYTRSVSGFDVRLPADALHYFQLTDGPHSATFAQGQVLLGGQFHAPCFTDLVRIYREIWESPDDARAAFDCVFPLFISEYGEFLGYDSAGRDTCLYEVSLSYPQPVRAFSSLTKALQVFAAYFEATDCRNDIAIAQQVHAQLDPETARTYWE